MQIRFFAIPALDPGAAEAELNAVLAAGRVSGLERQLVAAGAASFWAVAVTLVEGPGPLPAGLKAGGARRVDYREILPEADFAVFAQLRALRKSVAEAEAVPPYAVFTTEQLAAMVRERVTGADALSRIDGVGPARVARYGAAFLQVLAAAFGGRAP